MCIFSANIASVANTNIFARSSIAGRQFLVYSMEYQADTELAMILPLPTPPLPAEDAVRFIDLSEYADFFKDMGNGFASGSKGQAIPASRGMLQVHEVGSFEASFVPTLMDFQRLDDRFRLPENTWPQLPQYEDYSFAVFKLKAGAKTIHPIAFEFPRRDPEELFFPTIHVHHGRVESRAEFDHILFCQLHARFSDWMISPPARAFMKIAQTHGMIEPDQVIQMKPVFGTRKNEDIVLREQTG